MKDTLQPILSCALTIAICAAVHGQLVDTKFEKYTRFLITLILLTLLISPVLELFRAGELIGDGGTLEPDGTVDLPETLPETVYSDAVLRTLEDAIETDIRSVLTTRFGLSASEVERVRVKADGSDLQAIRVESIEISVPEKADREEIGKFLEERYDCGVRVTENA